MNRLPLARLTASAVMVCAMLLPANQFPLAKLTVLTVRVATACAKQQKGRVRQIAPRTALAVLVTEVQAGDLEVLALAQFQ